MTQTYLHQIPHIRDSLSYLMSHDPVFKKLDIDMTVFPWPHFDGGFPGLTRIVIGQQISTSAAKALWAKMFERIDPLTPENFLDQSDATLKSIGLSRQKQSYVRGLARAIQEGKFDTSELDKMTDNDVRSYITQLKGFGDWSANIYLLFCLARPNVWPAGDLGIRYGLQKYLNMSEPPDVKQTQMEKDRFAPHCSAASLLLWSLNK